MQKVYLNGDIAKFGSVWETSCRTIPEIFKLIDCQTPGFRKYLIDAADNGIEYEIRRGEEFVSEENLLLSLGKEDIIITEVPTGSKSGGAKLLVAAAIVALLVINPGGAFTTTTQMSGAAIGQSGTVTVTTGLNATGLALASVAVNLSLTGISQLIAPGPEADGADTNEGYLFNGPINTTKQGLPVPVAYGELIVGGAAISAAFTASRQPPAASTNFGPGFSNPSESQELDSPNTAGGGAYQDCFIADALVTMKDGTEKRIQEIVPGEEVKSQSGFNTVIENNAQLGKARLYSINNNSHFVTDTHPFLTLEGWKSFNPSVTREIHPGLEVSQLNIGDTLVTAEGEEVLEKFTKIYKTTPIFNLNVDGDDTYIVNKFIVHNK